MNLTDDQKVQIVCATVGAVTGAMRDEIINNPGKIAGKAVVIAGLTIAELQKRPLP